MAKRPDEEPEEPSEEEIKALYAKMREQFTAADLQKYTVIEKGIPAQKLIGEMQKIHERFKGKKG